MKKYLFAVIVPVMAGLIVLFVIPRFTKIPSGCIFQKTTGFYCAGCGLSRAVHALLRGNIERSAHQNILLLTAFPAALAWLSWRFYKLKFTGNKNTHDTLVIGFFIIIVVLFTVLRNIPLVYFNFLKPV